MDRCECEHDSHSDYQTEFRTGVHAYGNADAARIIKTPHGTFNICFTCKVAGHMMVSQRVK